MPSVDMAAMPREKNGPPFRSYAADAYQCIMVWASSPPHTSMLAQALSLLASSAPIVTWSNCLITSSNCRGIPEWARKRKSTLERALCP